MNRKGDGNFLTDNALSILVAILCILVLAFGIIKLYNNISDSETKNAQKTLDLVIQHIEDTNEKEMGTFTIQGFKGAIDWYIVGWGVDNSKPEERPDKCYLESCLCICKVDPLGSGIPLPSVRDNDGWIGVKERDQLKDACQSQGICRNINSFASVETTQGYTVTEKPLLYTYLIKSSGMTQTETDSFWRPYEYKSETVLKGVQLKEKLLRAKIYKDGGLLKFSAA